MPENWPRRPSCCLPLDLAEQGVKPCRGQVEVEDLAGVRKIALGKGRNGITSNPPCFPFVVLHAWRGLKAGLDHTDPGPAAQGILMCALNPSMKVPPEDTDRAFAGLEACGYLLEAAVLAALLGEEERAEGLWRRFCEVRQRAAGYFPDWLCEVETRAEEEKKALQAPAAKRLYEILRAGILPL